MKSKRNKKAGKHPSYDERGMSEESRKKKQEYDKKFSSSTKQKKKRADSNKKHAEAKKAGKNTTGLDYDHATGKFVKPSVNRGRKEKSRKKKK